MEITATASRHRIARRRVAVLAGSVVVIGMVAVGIGVDRSDASPPPDQRLCTWRPAADDIALGVGLLGTVRVQDGRTEVLHRVTCSDGTFRDAWMAAIS